MHPITQVRLKISWDIADTSEYQGHGHSVVAASVLPWNRQYGFHVLKLASDKKSFEQTFKSNNILKFNKTINTHTFRIGNQAD